MVWATQLDPDRVVGQWVDVVGDALGAVDEVLFVAAEGLEVGCIEAASYAPNFPDKHKHVLMLTPFEDPQSGWPFTIRSARLSPSSASFVISLRNAMEQELQLVAAPRNGNTALPGLFSAVRPFQGALVDVLNPAAGSSDGNLEAGWETS